MFCLRRVFVLLLAAAVVGGCSTIEVSSDYDPGADLSRLESYGWLPDPSPPAGDSRLDSSLLDARVRNVVDTQLAKRGYRQAPPEEADFLVTYHAALEKKIDVDTIYSSYGYGGGGSVVESEAVKREYERGTLLLDVVDPKTRQLLWRGSASAEIGPDDAPEERRKRTEKAVASMLERFPPR
jgi:hypothetical protein